MQRTEKRPISGRLMVILIVGLAVIAAVMAATRQQRDNPSAVQGRLLDDRTAIAEFSTQSGSLIRKGMRAIVSISDGEKHNGRVTEVELRDGTRQVSIELNTALKGAPAGTLCHVTVDTTIPPELLK